jgi:Methyltransferase domain
MGVRENIAIESREDNLQKCLRIKEKYGLDRTTFLLGNLEDFYNGTKRLTFSERFDLVFCLGVLYHVPDPGKALAWFRSQAKTLFLGTHYPEQDWAPAALYTYNGSSYRVMEYREGGIADPISGMSPISLVPYEADLLKLLRDVGYDRVSVLGHDLQKWRDYRT